MDDEESQSPGTIHGLGSCHGLGDFTVGQTCDLPSPCKSGCPRTLKV